MRPHQENARKRRDQILRCKQGGRCRARRGRFGSVPDPRQAQGLQKGPQSVQILIIERKTDRILRNAVRCILSFSCNKLQRNEDPIRASNDSANVLTLGINSGTRQHVANPIAPVILHSDKDRKPLCTYAFVFTLNDKDLNSNANSFSKSHKTERVSFLPL